MLKGAGNDDELDNNKIYLKLSDHDVIPDMISTNDLKEGQEVIIDIKGEPVWVAELSKDTRPGTLVSCSGEGKIEFTNTRDHKFYVGYTLEGGKAGDKVKYVRKTGVLGQSLDAGVEGKLDNGEEI